MKKALLICLCIIPTLLFAFETKKESQESFLAQGITDLNISNEHGNITFLHSNSDSIVVNASIVADVIEFADTGAIFRNIKPRIFKSGKQIKINTQFSDKMEYTSLIHVHYYISIPDTINLDITNRFGNILMFDVFGTKNIVLEYGKVFCSNLLGPELPLSKYSLLYSELKADTVSNADFYLNSSELRLQHIKKTNIKSVYSYVFIDKVENLTSTCETDRYQVNQVDYLKITGQSTTCLISDLNRFMELELEQGDLILSNISPKFTDVNLYLKEVNTEIGIAANAAYYLNASAEFGNITLPGNIKTKAIKDINTVSYNGQFGNANSSGSQIGIVSEYCDIKLKTNEK